MKYDGCLRGLTHQVKSILKRNSISYRLYLFCQYNPEAQKEQSIEWVRLRQRECKLK